MRTTALISAALIASASAQEEYNLLRGERFLAKGDKSMSTAPKTPKRDRHLDYSAETYNRLSGERFLAKGDKSMSMSSSPKAGKRH